MVTSVISAKGARGSAGSRAWRSTSSLCDLACCDCGPTAANMLDDRAVRAGVDGQPGEWLGLRRREPTRAARRSTQAVLSGLR